MKSTIEFQKEEYEKLMEVLGLSNDNYAENTEREEYFNAWGFGLQEEDCNFKIGTSLGDTPKIV